MDGQAKWNSIEDISDNDVATLVTKISQSVLKHLRKLGYLDKHGEVVQNPVPDDVFQDSESVSIGAVASIAGKIAFGPNAGNYVTKIGSGFGFNEEIPLAKGRLCFSINGFSLHANTHINALQRDRLHQLIEYLARGPISNERLEVTADGKVKLRLIQRYLRHQGLDPDPPTIAPARHRQGSFDFDQPPAEQRDNIIYLD